MIREVPQNFHRPRQAAARPRGAWVALHSLSAPLARFALATRRFAPILALLLALAPAVATALPVVDVYAGYDGFFRPGEWAPVVVTVNNQPSSQGSNAALEDFEGVLSIPSDSLADPAGLHLFTRNIKVPAYSIQRFYLYAKFPETPSAPALELRTTNGRLLATYPLNVQPLTPGNVLLLTVAKDLAPLRLPPLPGVDPVMRANTPPDRLPEQWWGYESCGALILTTWSETYLRPAQEAALEQWLKTGGTLVVLTGSDAAAWKGGLIDRALPGTVTKSERIRVNPSGGATLVTDSAAPIEKGDIVVSRLEPNLDAQILASVDGLPLLARSRFGRGTVLFFAVDFQNNADAISQVFTPLWRAVIPYDPVTGTRFTWRSDMRASTQVVSRRAARPPNVFLIFILLVGYVVAVGPLNFRYLSKRKKVEWAWITVPVIVLFFSALIYGIGALTKGGQLIAREATLVEGAAGESTATLDGLIGLFSPTKTRYRAAPQDSNLAVGRSDEWSKSGLDLRRSYAGFRPVTLSGSSGGLLSFAGARTVVRMEEEKQVLSELPLGQWDLGFISAYGLINLEGAVAADLTYYGNQVAGTIKNGTGRTLVGPVLYCNGFAHALPRDLLPGDSFELPKDKAYFPQGASLGEWGIPSEIITRQILERKSGVSEDEKLAAQTRSYLAHYMLYPALTAKLFPPHGGETWLLAFSDESVADVTLSEKPNVFTHSVCYAFKIPVRPAKGNLTIAEGQAHTEMLLRSLDGDVYFVDDGTVEMTDGACVLSATLPFESPTAQVTAVKGTLSVEVGSNQDFNAEILDLQSSRWVDIPYEADTTGTRHYSITLRGEASRFVTPLTGRVFFRVNSKRSANQSVNFMRNGSGVKRFQVSYEVAVP